MDTVLLLRSYGDFVIALSGFQGSSLAAKSLRIVASDHFRPLYQAIADMRLVRDLPAVEFVNLGVRYGLMACFTNRHFFTTANMQELKKLRDFLATIPGNHNLFLEQKIRLGFISAMTGRKFTAIYDGAENIYKAYRIFFQVKQLPFQDNWRAEPDSNSIIRVFPGSRKKTKRLPVYWVEHIKDQYGANGRKITLAGLSGELLDYTASKELVGNFRELCYLIAESDYIISADSLPAHLAYLFQIPLEVHYNRSINSPWLPPGAVAKLVEPV